MRVLVLEDNEDIRNLVCQTLLRSGYAVDEARRATEAEGLIEMFSFDLMVLDIGLPEGPKAGFDLVNRMRNKGIDTPVLFLTAYAHPEDRIKGLDVGADDYLVKPFDIGELLARLRALQRRIRTNSHNVFEQDQLQINWNNHQVTLDGASIHLTAKEFALLEILASQVERIYSKEELIERVWGGIFDADSNVVEVLVRNIRRKLGDSIIETVRGIGYRFSQGNPA